MRPVNKTNDIGRHAKDTKKWREHFHDDKNSDNGSVVVVVRSGNDSQTKIYYSFCKPFGGLNHDRLNVYWNNNHVIMLGK